MSRTTRQVPVWKTRDGREIPIRDMTDEHLINAILLIYHTFERSRSAAEEMATLVHGEIASDVSEAQLDRMMEMDGPGDMWPIYNELVAEKDKRFKDMRRY